MEVGLHNEGVMIFTPQQPLFEWSNQWKAGQDIFTDWQKSKYSICWKTL